MRTACPSSDLESPHLIQDPVNNTKTIFVYDGDQPVVRYDGSSTASRVYYLEDGMGTIIGQTDNAGVAIANYEYDSFGVPIGNEAAVEGPNGLAGDFRFHGLWRENRTTLYMVRARVYDPPQGRFLSRDPEPGIFEKVESYHEYSFSDSNPQVFVTDFSLIVFLAKLSS